MLVRTESIRDVDTHTDRLNRKHDKTRDVHTHTDRVHRKHDKTNGQIKCRKYLSNDANIKVFIFHKYSKVIHF